MVIYIEKQLADTGYDKCVITTRLVGDASEGVAWYGKLNTSRLITRLMTGEDRKAAMSAYANKGAYLQIVCDKEVERFGLIKTMVVEYIFNESLHITESEDRAIKLLKSLVENDVYFLAHKIYKEIAAIRDANISESKLVQIYRSGRYQIIVSEVPDRNDLDDLALMPQSVVKDIINGHLRRHGMRTIVKRDDTVLGSSTLYGFLSRLGMLPSNRRFYAHAMATRVVQEHNGLPDGS